MMCFMMLFIFPAQAQVTASACAVKTYFLASSAATAASCMTDGEAS